MRIGKIGTGPDCAKLLDFGPDFSEEFGPGIDIPEGGIGIGGVSLLPFPALVLLGQFGGMSPLPLHFVLLSLPRPVVLVILF